MSLDSRTRLALEHMLDAVVDLRALLGGKGQAEFAADRLCQRGVERCLKVVSEASRRLPAQLKAAHPDIKWRSIAGIGNVLRHDYDEIDAGVVWRTATIEIEPLARLAESLLAGLQQGGRAPRTEPRARSPTPRAAEAGGSYPPSNRLAITCAWISAAPSKMLRMRASHRIRLIWYSMA